MPCLHMSPFKKKNIGNINLHIFFMKKIRCFAGTVLSSAFDAKYKHVGATKRGSNSAKLFLRCQNKMHTKMSAKKSYINLIGSFK